MTKLAYQKFQQRLTNLTQLNRQAARTVEVAHQGIEVTETNLAEDIEYTSETIVEARQLIDNLVMLQGRLVERQQMLNNIQHNLDEGGKLYDVIKAADATANAALLADNLAWMEEAILATSPKELRKVMAVADEPALKQAFMGLERERLKIMVDYSIASLVLIYGDDFPELEKIQDALSEVLDASD